MPMAELPIFTFCNPVDFFHFTNQYKPCSTISINNDKGRPFTAFSNIVIHESCQLSGQHSSIIPAR